MTKRHDELEIIGANNHVHASDLPSPGRRTSRALVDDATVFAVVTAILQLRGDRRPYPEPCFCFTIETFLVHRCDISQFPET